MSCDSGLLLRGSDSKGFDPVLPVGGEVVGRKYENKNKIHSDLGQDDESDVSSDSRISRRGSDPLNKLVDSVSIDGKQNQNQNLTNPLASQVLPAAGDAVRTASLEQILKEGHSILEDLAIRVVKMDLNNAQLQDSLDEAKSSLHLREEEISLLRTSLDAAKASQQAREDEMMRIRALDEDGIILTGQQLADVRNMVREERLKRRIDELEAANKSNESLLEQVCRLTVKLESLEGVQEKLAITSRKGESLKSKLRSCEGLSRQLAERTQELKSLKIKQGSFNELSGQLTIRSRELITLRGSWFRKLELLDTDGEQAMVVKNEFRVFLKKTIEDCSEFQYLINIVKIVRSHLESLAEEFPSESRKIACGQILRLFNKISEDILLRDYFKDQVTSSGAVWPSEPGDRPFFGISRTIQGLKEEILEKDAALTEAITARDEALGEKDVLQRQRKEAERQLQLYKQRDGEWQQLFKRFQNKAPDVKQEHGLTQKARKALNETQKVVKEGLDMLT